MAFNMRAAAAMGMRVAKSPMTKALVHVGKGLADVGSVAGVPGAGLVSKGLGAAEKVLDKLQGGAAPPA